MVMSHSFDFTGSENICQTFFSYQNLNWGEDTMMNQTEFLSSKSSGLIMKIDNFK